MNKLSNKVFILIISVISVFTSCEKDKDLSERLIEQAKTKLEGTWIITKVKTKDAEYNDVNDVLRFEIFDKAIDQNEGEVYFIKDGKEYVEDLQLGADTWDGIHGTLDAIDVGHWNRELKEDEKYARFWADQKIFFENGDLYIRSFYNDEEGNPYLELEITCVKQ